MKTSRGVPLLANSAAMIAQIKSDLLSNRQNAARILRDELRARAGRSAAPADPTFSITPMSRISTAAVSPNGLYPIPSNMPVERLAARDGRPDASSNGSRT